VVIGRASFEDLVGVLLNDVGYLIEWHPVVVQLRKGDATD
jgi:hypothetical protein